MRRVLSLCALLVAAACGDSTGPTPRSVAGTWLLQSVDGSALPYAGAIAGEQIVGGTLIVSPVGTFTYATTFRNTGNGQMLTATDSGRYVLSGHSVSFVFASDGSTGAGVFSGDSVTVAAEGLSLVYRKPQAS